MSSKDTHLIASDLALAVWSLVMLVNGKTPSCCFITRLQSRTFVILTVPICSWQHDKYVLIHQHTFNCYFLLPLIFTLKFNQK